LELKATQSHSLVSMEPSTDLESILDLTKFSTLSRLIGVTAKVLRAVQRFKNLKKRGESTLRWTPWKNPRELSSFG